MTIASEILKAQNNLKECYDVCKSVDGVVLPEDKNFDNLPALIEQALNPFNKPSDWSDIRVDCPADSIALYAAHSADYSSYNNLGFIATCVGGYNVFIDGTQYGSTYASGSQCNITWSSLALDTGDDITTPTVLKAHKIWIEPATEGDNISYFHFARVAASGQESQGVLWEHFNLTNEINLYMLNCRGNLGTYDYANIQLLACTAKNNKINCNSLSYAFFRCANLEYIPQIINTHEEYNVYFAFANCEKLANINLKMSASGNNSYAFYNCQALKAFPKGLNLDNVSGATDFLTQAKSLQDTVVDFSKAKTLTKVGTWSSSTNFASGIKGLRVSNEAPFTGAAPQINVNYTGMDRTALVQLFNDLPTVSAGQIINIVGCTGATDLTVDDELIATAKGWTITK